ncbi:hypothetical protein [Spirilliplanes yamanashiensis]|uniref:Uncharacterized protein n=1 Tax=Spirilliplanes yamanashiensis TaxID=42233 RepID=A0A8J3YD72_9ACTN|nr:hypothetical protein [Spirilliplanes yamanashiensis]MDP9816402.1 hypothetical protein [Spirilliplanes yamanashiensis]GIJ05929.1 hypothetical protein Sya03_52810 [Spirilliplanes yamanashiensis]
MSDLTTAGRRGRLAATAVAGVLLLAGTLFGQDDHFPFGPFRMYSTAPGPDDDAPDTRVEGVDATGRTIVLTETNSGIRRAEIEGQQRAYVADPARLRQVAAAYAEHNPGAPALTEVRIVIRWQGVEDSRPTGTSRDEVVVRWAPS